MEPLKSSFRMNVFIYFIYLFIHLFIYIFICSHNVQIWNTPSWAEVCKWPKQHDLFKRRTLIFPLLCCFSLETRIGISLVLRYVTTYFLNWKMNVAAAIGLIIDEEDQLLRLEEIWQD